MEWCSGSRLSPRQRELVQAVEILVAEGANLSVSEYAALRRTLGWDKPIPADPPVYSEVCLDL